MRAVVLLLMLAVSAGSISAQQNDKEYRLTLSLGAGYSRFITTLNINGLNRNGFGAMARLMWSPEHLLSVGFETGYHYLYTYSEAADFPEFGRQSARVTFAGIPLHLVFSMRINRSLSVLLGSGGSLLLIRANALGSRNHASQWTTGNFAGIAYRWTTADRLHVGSELKYYGIHKTEGGNIVLLVTVAYDIMRY